MRFVAFVFFTFALAMPVGAANRNVTLYLDGALVEQECTVMKGLAEISLPAAMNTGSLRIKPLDGGSITQVEILPARPDRSRAREVAKLMKQRDTLTDRMQALDTREAIFKSAAKSQSGKAPRKTKNNPDPIAVVRQGTEFAMAQLENVYRARRLTESELKSIEARLAAMNREGPGSLARVRMSGKGGRVTVSYLRSDMKWIPAYDFRLNRPGEANIALRALIPEIDKNTITKVVPTNLSDASGEAALSVPPGKSPQIAEFLFHIDHENYVSTPVSSISFSFRNSSTQKLLAGEVSCYRQGEFLGKTVFRGSLPGEVNTLAFGK